MTEHEKQMDWSTPTADGTPPVERVSAEASAGPLVAKVTGGSSPGTPVNRAFTWLIYLMGGLLWIVVVTGSLTLIVKVPRWISASAGVGGATTAVVLAVYRTRDATSSNRSD